MTQGIPEIITLGDLTLMVAPPEYLGIVADPVPGYSSQTKPLVVADAARREGVFLAAPGPQCDIGHVPPELASQARGNNVYKFYDRALENTPMLDVRTGLDLPGTTKWSSYGKTINYVPLRGLVVTPRKTRAIGAVVSFQCYPWIVSAGRPAGLRGGGDSVANVAVCVLRDGRVAIAYAHGTLLGFSTMLSRSNIVVEAGYLDGGGSSTVYIGANRFKGPDVMRRLGAVIVFREPSIKPIVRTLGIAGGIAGGLLAVGVGLYRGLT